MEKTRKLPFIPKAKPGFEREWEFGRFFLDVDFGPHPKGCWLWTRNPGRGRGAFQLRGVTMDAHRAAYIITFGDPGPLTQVHHNCEVKRCVNPFHLRGVSREEHAKEHPEIAHFIERRKRDVCVKGLHPMEGDNLIVRPSGKRQCRECENVAQRAGSSFHRGEHKTECKHGHPWTEENVRVKANGHKECRVCHRERERARQNRLRGDSVV